MTVVEWIVSITIAAIFALSLWIVPSYECGAKAEKQGYEHSWGIVEGCMMKIDGKWIDYDKWRAME